MILPSPIRGLWFSRRSFTSVLRRRQASFWEEIAWRRMKHTNNKKTLKKFLKREWSNVSLIAFVLFLTILFGGKTVFAEDVIHPTDAEQKATGLKIAAMANALADYGALPESGEREASRTMTVTSTAYSSDVAQTDSTPFITASGTTVRHGIVAANFLPIGTLIKIPDIYGDEVFVVEDRMNARYSKRMDIWMETREEAMQFGVRRINIEIYD